MDLSKCKVLVTGADGFIGSHLTEMLVSKGARVRALSYYNSFNNQGWLEDINCLSEIEVISGDIRDSLFVNKLTKDIDVVFHLAALIAIPYSYIAPMSYIETNVKGTLNICEAAIQSNCQKVIHTSTSEVYGTAVYTPIDEKHPLQPQSPYSASKIGADQIAFSYFYSYGLPLTVLRPFNTFGPRQSARAVIPSVILQILRKNRQIEVGDVTPLRDFSFVIDTCKAFISLVENDSQNGEVYNSGSNKEISIADTISIIKNIMSVDTPIKQVAERGRPSASEVRRLWCDNRKLGMLNGFLPKTDFEDALRKTIGWYSEGKNQDRFKAVGNIL